MKPIRVLHFVWGLGKHGVQTGLENLLGGLDRDRLEHVVCVLRPPIDDPTSARLRQLANVMCVGQDKPGGRFQTAMLARAIRQVQPDIVHSRNFGCIEAVVAGRLAGCAVVHGEHGIDFVEKEPSRRTWFRRLAYELADRVVSVSYQLREHHSKRTGFPANKITVIHNGVDSSRYCADASARARVRNELGLSETEFCIGSVGNLSAIKDYPTELQAIAHVAEVIPDWRLVVIGEGSERSRLEAFVDAHPNWKHRVMFRGVSPRVPEVLNAFDVYVLPSLSEGISNSLLEAMATGLPVIVTATGGNPEVVVEGRSGLLFPVGDARQLAEQLLLLHRRHDVRAELGRQARERVRAEFSIDSMARRYDELYTSVIENRGRRRDTVRVADLSGERRPS